MTIPQPNLPTFKPNDEPVEHNRILLEEPEHVNTNRLDFNRMFAAEAPDYATNMSYEDVCAHMDKFGWDLLLEEIARGNLPNVLALRYKVPIIKFRRWLDSRVPEKKLLDEAMSLCAESMVAKSQMSLMQDVEDATQGAMMREFSKRVSVLAERIAPEDWAPKKDYEGLGGSGGGAAIQINIQGGTLIPGTEVLASPAVPGDNAQVIEHKPKEVQNEIHETEATPSLLSSLGADSL